ncbi:uncharacterized protein LOC125658141 isoform X1 [Ostrea edulis]|uniref:uncharacterized protein LOC125658141 isoform X1 n=2 Tax=Ostrea edulis TaxID=37623 RepID=UPI00209482DA|nr:uncharacterized protein LOC125658141 isoform X1 [Ostrea edulis]
MSMSEAMLSENSIISPIEQQGNFFIMDSEQLVSNPLQEMQNEAMDNQKKSSLTERLVSVKNNVCEKHFLMKADKINKELSHSMKKIHDNSSELRYQIKLYDINKRKIDLETRQRIQPRRDFSYDAFQIQNSEKRLGVLSDCYYLEKKQKFPIRGRNMNDLNATPTVSRARNMLRQQEKEDREDELSSLAKIRQSTPGTFSLSSNRASIYQRRGSKSAPASKMSASVRETLNSQSNSQDGDSAKLPSIERQKTKDSHVKFTENVRTSTPNKLIRPLTHGPRITRRLNAWDSDDEDDFGSTDYINLRQLLFGAENKTISNGSSGTPRTLTRESSRSVPNLRRTNAPKMTQEMLIAERKEIDKKISKFFESLEYEDDSEESEEEPEPDPKKLTVPAVAKAAALLNIFSKTAQVEENPFLRAKIERESREVHKNDAARSTSSRSTYSNRSAKEDRSQKKNLWKFIKTNMNNGKVKRCSTPSKIILQQMTRLDLSQNDVSKVPLHSAGRALRHTPTFKMRKVVEKLMKSRTKFQQQEVDLLRQQLEQGENISEVPSQAVPTVQSLVM